MEFSQEIFCIFIKIASYFSIESELMKVFKIIIIILKNVKLSEISRMNENIFGIINCENL